MTSDDNKTVEEKVDELQSPDTFDFISVLSGDTRSYPKDEVTVFLDEQTAHTIPKLEAKAAGMDSGEKFDTVTKQITELRKKLAGSAYKFRLTGISQDMKETVLKSAQEKFPTKYDTNKNFLTGGIDRTEKPNPERDRYFSSVLYQAHVEQIVAPDGAVDTAPTAETMDAFLRKAPESQVMRFLDVVHGLQVTAETFEAATNEDFLVKS